jgi:hypothetical protein
VLTAGLQAKHQERGIALDLVLDANEYAIQTRLPVLKAEPTGGEPKL